MADQPPVVLVVEDDPLIAAFMRAALRKMGHRVSSVSTGGAALAKLGADPVDLMLLDLTLPDTDGLEVLRTVRGDGSDLPVVVVTSRSDPADRATAVALGVSGYIVKPFPLADLFAVVRQALGERVKRA